MEKEEERRRRSLNRPIYFHAKKENGRSTSLPPAISIYTWFLRYVYDIMKAIISSIVPCRCGATSGSGNDKARGGVRGGQGEDEKSFLRNLPDDMTLLCARAR